MLRRNRPGHRRSGKRDHVVVKRHAYNHYLGAAVHQWAFCSLSLSPWAREFYNSKIAAGQTCHAALRALSLGVSAADLAERAAGR